MTRHGTGRVAGIVLIGGTMPVLARAVDSPAGIDPPLFKALQRDVLLRDFPGCRTWPRRVETCR